MQRAFLDSEELSQALQHTRVHAIQMSRGAFQAEFSRHLINDWTLQSIDFLKGSSVCAGDAPLDRHAIVIPGHFTGDSRLLGRTIDQSTMAVYSPGSEHADVTHSGTSMMVVVLPQLVQAEVFDCGLWLPKGSRAISVSPTGLDRFRHLVQRIPKATVESDGILDQPEARRCLSDDLMRAILDISQHATVKQTTRGRPQLPRPIIIRRTLEILDERRDVPIYVTELAAELGISQPTLQRLFLEWFGMPPARYLQIKRFYLARRRLRDRSTNSVTDVAMALGFWDLSRFSRGYKSLFGELPSQTLRTQRRI